MIAIGIIGLCLVAVAWVLLYLYFIRRTDRFMDNWEKGIKEKAEKATLESLQTLQEAANALGASVKSVQSLQEAAEAIKASREAMEKFAYEKGFIPRLPTDEIKVSTPITEPKLEPIPSPSPAFQYGRYKSRKHKEWGPWIPSPQPLLFRA